MSTHEDTTPVIAAIRSTLLVALCVILLLAGLQLGASRAAGQAASDDGQATYLPSIFQAAPVQVAAIKASPSRANTYRVVGELVNVTNSPAYSVTLEVRVYDAEDRLLGTNTGQPVFFATVPGQRNPFESGVNVSFWQVARSEIRVVDWSLSHSPPYAPVTIVSTNLRTSGSALIISGELRNDTGYVLEDVRVAAWSFDQLYTIAGTRPVVDRLPPGAVVPYEETVIMSGSLVPPKPHFGVGAQGIVQP
jgi:hypothetical protein